MEMVFQLANEVVAIKIIGTTIYFSNQMSSFQLVPIDAIRFDIAGIYKEFPDLKGKGLSVGELRREALIRFKLHCKELGSEIEIQKYIKKEFTDMGYKLKMEVRDGFRPTIYK